MRVLVVTTVHTPLDARIHHRQIRAMCAAGFGVTYVAPWRETGTDPADAMEGVVAVDVPRALGRARLRALRAANTLVRRLGPQHDLVLLHDADLLAVAAWQHRRLPPIVWDVHEDTAAALVSRPWVPSAVRVPVAWAIRRTESWAERRLHLVLAERGYAARFKRPHPVILNVPYVPATTAALGSDRVVYLGRVARSRGAADLITLGQRVRPQVTVELIGQADDDVRPAIEAAHARGDIVWHGFVPNERALGLLEGAAAGLSLLGDEPNYRVSMPTKVLEYLAYGVPVITTPLPQAVAVVEGHDAGIVVGFGDIDAAEAAVRALVADPVRQRHLGQRGRRVVEERYSWDVEGERFVALLRGWAAREEMTSRWT
jgi:glycosyltransferase involved in cell wall biosynthesis